jgi:hypothetical protein
MQKKLYSYKIEHGYLSVDFKGNGRWWKIPKGLQAKKKVRNEAIEYVKSHNITNEQLIEFMKFLDINEIRIPLRLKIK